MFVEVELYDVIYLSMVVNCVFMVEFRGEMIVCMVMFLCLKGLFFMMFSLRCVTAFTRML